MTAPAKLPLQPLLPLHPVSDAGDHPSFLEQKHLPLNNYLPLDSAQALAELSDRNGDPLEAYLKQEEEQLRRQKIKTLLSGLEQETLTLYLNGLSYEEMAQQLGCSTKAVDNALQRVRRKLQGSTR